VSNGETNTAVESKASIVSIGVVAVVAVADVPDEADEAVAAVAAVAEVASASNIIVRFLRIRSPLNNRRRTDGNNAVHR